MAAEKAKHTAQRIKGKVKAAAGAVTGNRRLERKGKRDQAKGSIKQAGQNVKDAVRGR